MTQQYLDMIELVLEKGEERADRTGTGTVGVFGHQVRYNLADGFPLLTTKDMEELFPKIFYELMWFIKGDTNIRYLVERNVNIWNADAYRWFVHKVATVRDFAKLEHNHLTQKEFIHLIKTDDDFAKKYGDLGRIYGKQWTDFGGHKAPKQGTEFTKEHVIGIHQLSEALQLIKNDPKSRRIIVSAWNPYDMEGMALPPCHVLFQFYVHNDGRLDLQLYQRSADLFLGVPFNIASYSMLLHMVAHICGLKVGEFIHTFGDLHIYTNHMEQVKEQLTRSPLPLPQLHIRHRNGLNSLEDFRLEDFELVGYNHHTKLTGKVSVGK